MLRSLTYGAQRLYPCLCWQSQQLNVLNNGLDSGRMLSTSTASFSFHRQWNKELKGKKEMTERSLKERQEEIVATEVERQEKIEGLVESGAILPTLETHAQVFDGVRYDELPIVHIKSSLNNTLLTLTNHNGKESLLHHSCGLEGYKNIKKTTTVAAQTTAYTFGKRAVKLGVTNVRILVRGLGSGRLVSLKGLEMAGLNIVSITDNTPIPHNGNRPRKIRRQ